MRLLFLGTAAAEGYPGIFCSCEYCSQARRLGGKNLRFRSALLVNQVVLIDFGPDIQAAALRLNQSLWGVTTGLVTHAHSDHFYPGNFGMRADAFTGKLHPPTIHLYGSRDVATILDDIFPDQSVIHLESHTVKAFESWQSGDYTITAYRAFHAVESLEALFYGLEDGSHAILYATDTGSFTEDTRQALSGRSFDIIVMEETMGEGNYEQHLGFTTFLEQVQWIRTTGLLRRGGRVIATHFSHSGNPIHAELEAIFQPYEIEVAFDGMEIFL